METGGTRAQCGCVRCFDFWFDQRLSCPDTSLRTREASRIRSSDYSSRGLHGHNRDGVADVIIIGAGVIGCALALELSRRGHRTLNIDKAAAAGAGSTINSCAIVRFTYSTEAGVTFAWEGGHYWRDWENYIGTEDELGLIEFHQVGQLVLTTEAQDHSAKVKKLWERLDIPHESWSREELAQRYPFLDHGLYGPPTRPEDPSFWKDSFGSITGALFSPDAGYVSDPQLSCHNLQRGAEALGGHFLFNSEVDGDPPQRRRRAAASRSPTVTRSRRRSW